MKISSTDIPEEILDPRTIRILRQLAAEGILTERRLAKYTGMSHVTAHHILNRLARLNLASSKRVGRANLWSLNRQSYAYLILKPILSALNKVGSPLEVLKKTLLGLLPLDRIKKMILFGSIFDGTEKDESDIDLCIILRSGICTDDIQLKKSIDLTIDRCYQLFGKRFSPYLISERDWKKKQDSPLGLKIKEGQELYP